MKRIALVFETALMFFVISFNATDASTLIINEIMSSNNSTLKDRDGDYPDWIEIHNYGESSIDLTGYGLSDDEDEPMRWVFPELTIEQGSYSIVFASGKDKVTKYEIHANFKIKSSGEPLLISNPEGILIDRAPSLNISSDISLGRDTDNTEHWLFFKEPTPSLANTTQGYSAAAAPVIMSLDGGFYDSDITVALSCDTPGVLIRYTLDGYDPDETSAVYDASLTVSETTVVKARAFAEGSLPGPVCVNTYFIGTGHSLPVISISSQNIEIVHKTRTGLDPQAGIPEKPVCIEFFEPDGTRGFNIVAGLRLHGASRRFNSPPRSYAVMARKSYGTDTINYPLFPDSPITSFSSFLLRTARLNLIFRDPLINWAVKDIDLDNMAYRPAVLYLNGEYAGQINIREKQNEAYLASHHNIDPDNVDILEYSVTSDDPVIVEGDTEHYDDMMEYMTNNSMQNDENFDYIKTQMDVENYLRYYVTQIYYVNTDFPNQNIKWWRPKTSNGKWRWLFYDIDAGLWNYDFPKLAVEAGSTNIKSKILRSLLSNQQCKYDFINLFADYNVSIFNPERILAKIDQIKSDIEPEMLSTIQYWLEQDADRKYKYAMDVIPLKDMDTWYASIDIMKEFVKKRPEALYNNIIQFYGLSGAANISLNVNPPEAGKITINTLTIDEFPWTNTYFNDVPIPLSVVPNPGYTFTGWTGINSANTASPSLVLSGDVTITANFEKDSEALNTIVINEINYNSASDFDPGDWVELHSLYDVPIDISGWVFKDDDDAHGYIFPPGTRIEPNGYLVLCREETLFHRLFPDIETCAGSFGFGLNDGGEHIRLFDSQGTLIDSLTYDDTLPWPEEPDRSGPTLALSSSELDNSMPNNWFASSGHGTPGTKNGGSSMVHEMHIPEAVLLGQNYPNPFNSSTTIGFSLPRHGYVKLVIYNVMGQKVRALITEDMGAGSHSIVWNGHDDTGAIVSSGLYFALLTIGKSTAVSGMLLAK
ncbi:lamin tail domain-containing protein [Candidatus Omnitrophota bacterium]